MYSIKAIQGEKLMKILILLAVFMAFMSMWAYTLDLGSATAIRTNVFGGVEEIELAVSATMVGDIVRGVSIKTEDIELTLSSPQQMELMALLDKYREWSSAAQVNGHNLDKNIGIVSGVQYRKFMKFGGDKTGTTFILVAISSVDPLNNVLMIGLGVEQYYDKDFIVYLVPSEDAAKLLDVMSAGNVDKTVRAYNQQQKINDLYK